MKTAVRALLVAGVACSALEQRDPLEDFHVDPRDPDMAALERALDAPAHTQTSAHHKNKLRRQTSAVKAVHTKTEVMEGDALDAANPIIPFAIRSNYREGFAEGVKLKPNLPALAKPTVNNVAFEESRMRSSVAKKVEEVLKIEQLTLTAKLKENSAKAAAKFAKVHSVDNAKFVSVRAFGITKGLLQKKATKTCQFISNEQSLPKICAVEAGIHFDKLLPDAANTWAPQAAVAIEAPTTAAATKAAFDAVKHVPTVVAPPIAYQRARRVFDKMWPKIQFAFQDLSAKRLSEMEAMKTKFWDDAEKDLNKRVQDAVRKAIWDKPIKHANKVIVRTARIKADKETAESSARYIAPYFARAAKLALTRAVRAANSEYISTWHADWDLADGTTDAIKQ